VTTIVSCESSFPKVLQYIHNDGSNFTPILFPSHLKPSVPAGCFSGAASQVGRKLPPKIRPLQRCWACKHGPIPAASGKTQQQKTSRKLNSKHYFQFMTSLNTVLCNRFSIRRQGALGCIEPFYHRLIALKIHLINVPTT